MKFVIPVLASFMTMSISNRRIEVCCILRRQAANWWINVFKDLFNDADLLHVEGIRYCFMDVLQNYTCSNSVGQEQYATGGKTLYLFLYLMPIYSS